MEIKGNTGPCLPLVHLRWTLEGVGVDPQKKGPSAP